MSAKELVEAFNSHLNDFVNDVFDLYEIDSNIIFFKSMLGKIIQFDKKLIITLWQPYVALKYMDHINQGNLDYFVNKEYDDGLLKKYLNTIPLLDLGEINLIDFINFLKDKIKTLTPSNKDHVIKYMQNLDAISKAYIDIVA